MKQFIFIILLLLIGMGLLTGPYLYKKYYADKPTTKITKSIQQPQPQALRSKGLDLTTKSPTTQSQTQSPAISFVDTLFNYAQKLLGLFSMALGTVKGLNELKKLKRKEKSNVKKTKSFSQKKSR